MKGWTKFYFLIFCGVYSNCEAILIVGHLVHRFSITSYLPKRPTVQYCSTTLKYFAVELSTGGVPKDLNTYPNVEQNKNCIF